MTISQSTEVRKRVGRRVKRAFDLFTVLATAPITLPVGALTGATILTRLGRPVLYRQPRTGLQEQEFELLKFRTMSNATTTDGELLSDRERLTPLGQILRRLSLDELPQLLNVFKGEMSLVGPRPLYTHYLPYYTIAERQRHTVPPGITGLAQVSGRNDLLWNQRLALDAYYVQRASVRQDMTILWMTALKLLRRNSGVSVVAGDSGEPLNVARSYPVVAGYTMRRFETADIPSRVQWMKDDRIRTHMSLPTGLTREGTQQWLARVRQVTDRFDLTMTEVGSDQPIAMIGLTPRDQEELPELYIFVDPERISEGLGPIALKILTQWMEKPGSPKGCWLSVARENVRAVRLYRKLGFQMTSGADSDRIRMEWSAHKELDA